MVTNSSFQQLAIFEGQTIGAIQKIFSDRYPYLRIDLFRNLELNGIRITKKLENAYGLFQLPQTGISLLGDRTVKCLKDDIRKATGLVAKIFRRSGNVWIETSLTDDWTLERQNEEGKLMVPNQ